jgi:HK97 family phage portal protein
MISFFKRKEIAQEPKATVKSFSGAACDGNGSFFNFLYGANQYDLAYQLLSQYYLKASPVADAIDRIAKEFASITPKIYDIQNDEFLTNTNFLDVLKAPNAMMTEHQFLFNLAATYLIYGNLLAYGTGVSKIQELHYIEPQYITLNADQFNTLTSLYVNKSAYSQTYKLQELNNQSFFVAPNQVARYIRAYNPLWNYSNQRGVSRLAAISYEIEQFIFASIHNLTALTNAVKPSGIISADFNLTDEQYERLDAQIKAFYGGASNTARVLMLDNGMDFTPIMTRTDSDYQTLRKNVEAAIYRRLEIPLALVTDSAMTYNNLEVANLMLYDNAVLPLAKLLYKQLQDIIFYYNKIDPARYMITYDENDIEALAIRKSQLIAAKVSASVYTMNEIRQLYGDKPLVSGGDDVYVQSTQIPVASDNEQSLYVNPTDDVIN